MIREVRVKLSDAHDGIEIPVRSIKWAAYKRIKGEILRAMGATLARILPALAAASSIQSEGDEKTGNEKTGNGFKYLERVASLVDVPDVLQAISIAIDDVVPLIVEVSVPRLPCPFEELSLEDATALRDAAFQVTDVVKLVNTEKNFLASLFSSGKEAIEQSAKLSIDE